MDNRLQILDLPGDTRQLVGACEVTGNRTLFERNGRPVAILISFDEYIALTETIDIARDTVLRAEIEAGDAEALRNVLMLPEDLFES
jgi:PHD/YefM family antitoxin component YafN of YafNO toxin-antitoxin module